MLRVTTLHASSAAATAVYYARYLTDAPGEVPGVWSGRQADGFGLAGDVAVEQLEWLLSGRDPTSGTLLGRELVDRYASDGRVVRAVSGFDATFSAPKSLSVWWALTGDARLLEAHDVAVAAALDHVERFGSTTRVRSNAARLHPDTGGLTVATFRQTTSRADDPQIHTHAVISAKVQTPDGRWLALDARYLKRYQRMLGGLYQSVLRAELTHRFGVAFEPIVKGQAELAGAPAELLTQFSKRSGTIDRVLNVKLAEFRVREGRDPSRFEHAAIARQVAADTRGRKSGHGVPDLVTRWQHEAAAVGWTAPRLASELERAARRVTVQPAGTLSIDEVIDGVLESRSSWGRAHVVQVICDRQRPVSRFGGRDWARAVETAADRVIERLVDLDPDTAADRRVSDGRSVWIEPTAARYTSTDVLAQEEAVIAWALLAQADDPAPSATLDTTGLDEGQADAAAAVAGGDRLVLVVGPAGAGKTRTLAAAVDDLERRGRPVVGVTPTAKAARVLGRDTGVAADTVAKLLYDWHHPPTLTGAFDMPAGGTVVVDEAGMLSTPDLHDLIGLVEERRWRLALVGDPRQLQAVGRGGLVAELCANGRVETLERLHRFAHAWEAAASLELRHGDPQALATYQRHDRIHAGTLDVHLDHIAQRWLAAHAAGGSIAVVASSNDHVDVLNHTIQHARRAHGQLDASTVAAVAGGEHVHVGDVVMTRRNDRRLVTSHGEPVRNRETWTITAITSDGALTARRQGGRDQVVLPVEYVREHVRLGYAATEHGYQADTVDTAIALATAATSRRGLYVAMTRGRHRNDVHVVTDTTDVAEAVDVLDAVLAVDRADTPAVTTRRDLAQQDRTPRLTPRCPIPDWFPAYLDQARRAVAAAHQHRDRLEQNVRDADTDLAAAQRRLAAIDRDTSPARDILAHAKTRTQHARWEQACLQRELAAAPRRQRRQLRHQLDTAARQLDINTQRLQRIEAAAAPAVHAHSEALGDRHRAERRRDASRDAVDFDRHFPLHHAAERRLEALTTWHAWATGQPVQPERLHAAHSVLTGSTETIALATQWTTEPAVAGFRTAPERIAMQLAAPDPSW